MGIIERFPTLTGHDLEGKEVVIPRDLAGEARMLIVAFKRRHQLLVQGWSGVLADLGAAYPGLEVWEVPTLSSGYRPVRTFIDGGMRAGITDPHTRRHTLTVYTSLRDVQRRLGLTDFEDIHLYLLDRDGRVAWSGSGGIDDEQVAGLVRALEDLRGAGA
jgi:hypothetical protein